MVLGRPNAGFGFAGISLHVESGAGPLHVAKGFRSVMGVRAKLKTPGITNPLVETGQATDAAP